MSKLVAVYVFWPPSPRVSRLIFQRDNGTFHNVYEEYLYLPQIEAVEKIIEVFAKETKGFSGRFIEIDKRRCAASSHRMRRYVAERREDLYYQGSHLIGTHSRLIADIWIADNLNARAKLELIDEACEAASVPRRRLRDMDLVRAAQPRKPTQTTRIDRAIATAVAH
jgi:hypothetical protein